MDAMWRNVIWQQFGAAISTLENALLACPDDLWRSRLWRDGPRESELSEFWYVAFHALFWLDLYLSGSVEGFNPPAPFGLEELDPAGVLPERPYTKGELGAYLQHARQKARAIVHALTVEKARQTGRFRWGEPTFLELLLYNMRHVQEHAAQLNLFLGQRLGSAPGWVAWDKTEFPESSQGQ